MNLASVFSVPDTVMARRVGEEIVVLDLGGGEYFGLPDVGARMWELIVEGKSLGQVSDAIVGEFEVDRLTVEKDLIGLAGLLCGKGLLTLAPELRDIAAGAQA